MIVGVKFHMIDINSGVVHGMTHPVSSLCGIHTGFDNNISLEKTDKKITCKTCLRHIEEEFAKWDKSLDEEILDIDMGIRW